MGAHVLKTTQSAEMLGALVLKVSANGASDLNCCNDGSSRLNYEKHVELLTRGAHRIKAP